VDRVRVRVEVDGDGTLRPRHLLAGKILGLGLLGLGQLLLIAVAGLGLAAAAGSPDVDGDVIVAAALALAWFVVGYVFYAAAFGVLEDPDGTLATVVSFIPPIAPMTMPPRIALGEASALEVAGALAIGGRPGRGSLQNVAFARGGACRATFCTYAVQNVEPALSSGANSTFCTRTAAAIRALLQRGR
jgi:hypothetical protein